jgi:hypothetical protein
MVPDPGPFLSGFAAWLDDGHGVMSSRPRHVRDVQEFLAWYDVNRQEDVHAAARTYAEFGTPRQVISMRLLLEWLSQN